MARRESPFRGPLHCVVATVRAEGPLALYKGFLPVYGRQAPFNLLNFMIMEHLLDLVGAARRCRVDDEARWRQPPKRPRVGAGGREMIGLFFHTGASTLREPPRRARRRRRPTAVP